MFGLSKEDKKWLEEMMEYKIREALTVQVRMEKHRNLDSGQPLAVPEIEIKDVYLPAHWVEFLPFYEASIRGVQETSDHFKNSINAIVGVMLGMEGSIKSIGKLSNEINNRIEHKPLGLIK